MIQLRVVSPLLVPSPPLLLPSSDYRDDILEAVMPLWKRACFTTPASRFEVGESSATTASRQAGHTLAHMCLSPKTTAWNEFSSTMASAIICLATNQKFNFSKFIFESMIRNLDNLSGKFLMYPRDEVIHKELGDSLVRAATTASSLEAEQDGGDTTTTAQTWFESVPKTFQDSLTNARGNTLRSDEDRLKLDELMALCTSLQNRILDLEKTKTTQHNEIASLKKSSDNKESLGKDASKQGRIDAIDADEEITLVSVHDVNVSAGEEVFVAEQEVADEMEVVEEVVEVINTASLIIEAAQLDVVVDDDKETAELKQCLEIIPDDEEVTIDDIPLAVKSPRIVDWKIHKEGKKSYYQIIRADKTLKKRRKHFAAKRAKEKRNKPPTKAQQRQIMCTYLKNMKGYKLKDLKSKGFDSIQEMFDRAFKRQKVDDDKEIAELKQCLEIIPDDKDVTIDVIHLAVKSPRIVDWKIHKEGKKSYYQIIRADKTLKKRRKHFVAKRAEEKRNKPPTKSQHRQIMCTYLKNMEGYKLKDLKSKEFDYIQEMFDRAFKRINTFEDFRTELVEGKEKRAGTELIQENIKKQKVDDDKETAELKQCLEIIPDDEEVTIDAIPLVVKSPRIVDWKIHKEGKKRYYQIIRANGKSQIYGLTRPVESMDYLLWNDMKIIFEPHVEDEVRKLQNRYKVLELKLYDSCGVHFLRMQSMQIYMLVEKKYPLIPPTLSMMLEKKLQIDYESKMAYQLSVVYAGDKTSGDARSWYMISGDAKYVLIKVNGWFWRLKMCTLGDLRFKTE
ncbi:hypothetical protein Tco_1161125, partial [Tanacetum coccineum]